jgi:mono/diheme cytochrome c family protein
MMRTALLVGLLVGLGCGCGPKTGAMPGPLSPKQTMEATSRWSGASDFSTARGRVIFQEKCDDCHGYPDVHAISEASWPDIMDRMGPKAELKPDDIKDVLNFVRAAALPVR